MKTRNLLVVIIGLLCLIQLPAKGKQESEPVVSVPVVVGLETDESTSNWLIENTDDHITVVDITGNEITIQKPVKTLISNAMGEAFATLRALGAQDMILASSEYVTRNEAFFPAIAKLPSISMGQVVDNEMVVGLNPDLIISDPSFTKQFNEAILLEIPLVQLRFDTEESFKLLGAILGKEKEAEEFVLWIKTYTDIVDKRIGELSQGEIQDVFVYYGGQYGMSAPPPYGTFGMQNTLRNDLINRAGGRSISQDLPGDWITVDPEWIIEQNPPVIIRESYLISDTPEMGYMVTGDIGAMALMANIISQPAFELSDAVKNNNVHIIYGDLVNDSWFISLIYMAKWLHPGLFEDMDPEEMHQEYMNRFQGMDYNVREQGFFVLSSE